MFHWLCPECGREIAPSVGECAACEPKPARVPALTEAPGAPLLLAAPILDKVDDLSPGANLPPSAPVDPPSEAWLPLAPLQDYSPAASRIIQAAAPSLKILTPDSRPRVTLPGPALPPELASPQDINLAPVLPGKPALLGDRSLPGWVVSSLTMLALLLLGVVVAGYFAPLARSNAVSKVATPASRAPVVQLSSRPLAQYIEVTGFRILVDPHRQREIHYLVVNHSADQLSGMTIYVTLQSSNSRLGQPPLCRFSFRSPHLAPFESKEMASMIDTASPSAILPGWEDLHAELQVAQ